MAAYENESIFELVAGIGAAVERIDWLAAHPHATPAEYDAMVAAQQADDEDEEEEELPPMSPSDEDDVRADEAYSAWVERESDRRANGDD